LTALIISALVAPAAVCAQAVPATQPVKGTLDAPYVDGSFGFSIAPPAGCTTFRQKHLAGAGDVEVVQFGNLDYRWSLTVRVTTTTQPLDAQTIIDGLTKNISASYEDVKVVRGEEARIAEREGVRYAATFKADGTNWLRHQAVIRTKPTEYYALVFIAPAGDNIAESLFDKIVDSFQILRTELMQKRIEEALARGTQLLQSVRSGKIKLTKRVSPESFLRFVLDGKEIGFVRVREGERAQGSRSGVEVNEWAWLFKADNSITHLRHDMYLTDDLSFENWENRVMTIPPAAAGAARQVIYELESGLRQDNQLVAAFMPTPNASEMQDKIIEVEKSYASAAWHSLLPRIVDLNQPELYAFASYSADRRGLVLRTFEVIGPAQVTIDGRRVQAIKLQDSEGLIPPINEIDVDAGGRILRVVAGPLEMLATNRQDLEQRYETSVKEGQEILRKHPLKEPTPAPRDRPEGASRARGSNVPR